MNTVLTKFVFVIISSILLMQSFICARHTHSRDAAQPPHGGFSRFGGMSYFHRPWWAGRREVVLPKKVFDFKSLKRLQFDKSYSGYSEIAINLNEKEIV